MASAPRNPRRPRRHAPRLAGVDYESAAWPALWAHLEKLPVAIGAVRDQINAMLDSMVEHLNDEADD